MLHKGSIPVAIKELRFTKLTAHDVGLLRREVAAMASLHHDTLLKFHGWTDSRPYCLVLDLMVGALESRLSESRPLTPLQKTKIIYDIARGMRFLHAHDFVHRDIKPENVLLDAQGNAKIGDFGGACRMDDNAALMICVGTPEWMAPELQPGTPYTMKMDVYSYGLVVRAVLEESKKASPPIVNRLSPLGELIAQCSARHPDARWDFPEIVMRLRTGAMLFPGADKNEFLAYVAKTTESFDLEDRFPHCDDEFAQLIVQFEGGKLAESHLAVFLGKLLAFDGRRVVEVLQKLLASEHGKATCKYLRALRPMQINLEGLIDGERGLPADDIAIACIKQGSADQVCLHRISPTVRTIAFEAIARCGMRPQLETAVFDQCISYVKDHNEALSCAALRCLAGLERKWISHMHPDSLPLVTGHHSNEAVRCNAIIAAIQSRPGMRIPLELFQGLLQRAGGDPAVHLALSAGCTASTETAFALLEMIHPDGQPVGLECVLKMIMAIGVEENWRPVIAALIEKFGLDHAHLGLSRFVSVIRRAWKLS
jgi:serine/threonine protein kinase